MLQTARADASKIEDNDFGNTGSLFDFSSQQFYMMEEIHKHLNLAVNCTKKIDKNIQPKMKFVNDVQLKTWYF